MFTIEHEDEHTLIVVMDEKDEHEDLLVVLHYTDKVTIAQWSDDSDCYLGAYMTYAMLQDVSAALSLPEGIYHKEKAKEIPQ